MGWWEAGGPWGDLGGDKIQELQKLATTKADDRVQHAVPCKQGRRIRHRRIPPARPSNRRTMDSRFESLGVWGVMGSFLEPLGRSFFEPWGSFGVIFGPLGTYLGAFGGHFGSLGGSFGGLGAVFLKVWSSEPPSPIPCRSVLATNGGQMNPK